MEALKSAAEALKNRQNSINSSLTRDKENERQIEPRSEVRAKHQCATLTVCGLAVCGLTICGLAVCGLTVCGFAVAD